MSYAMQRSTSLFRILLFTSLLAVGTLLPLGATSVQAQPAKTIHFQGQLTDSQDQPVADESYQVTFRLFDQASGGSAIWQETQSVSTTDGVFSTQLGTSSSLSSLSFDTSYYLELAVGGETLGGRRPLTATPYAHRARLLDPDAIVGGNNVSISSQSSGALEISASGGGGLSSVAVDNTLTGDGTSSNPLGLVAGAVTGVYLDGQVLQAGSGISVSRDGSDNFVIENTSTGGGGLSSVTSDNTLTGDGTSSDPLALADGAVSGVHFDGQALQAGSGISISRDGSDNFVIENTSTGGGGLSSVASDNTLTGDGTSSDPLALADDAVNSDKVADGSLSAADLASGASGGNVLTYDGSSLTWDAPSGGFSLPFSGSVSSSDPAFELANTGSGSGIHISDANDGVHVSSGNVGVRVNTTFGLIAENNTNYGLRVVSPGLDGLRVEEAGRDGVLVTNPAEDGVQVDGAANRAVAGEHSSGNLGELGTADYGVHGVSTSNTSNAGYFEMSTTSGTALSAIHRGDGNAISGTIEGGGPAAVLGQSVGSGDAVAGSVVGSGSGVAGSFEISNSSSSNAVEASTNGSGDAIRVTDAGDDGVEVENADYGFYADNPSRDGVLVSGAGDDGIHVSSASALAGNFDGDVDIGGTLSKSGGSFKIDHPRDPENKYLQHSFVESPDMMNVYNGNVTLDANGEATVQLPDYFEALNRDFRYQLTAIGAPGPGLHVAEEISGNQFRIAGGEPGMKVSWQVTGIRQDPYAQENRIQVEVDKPAEKQGTYRHPEAYDAPTSRGEAAQERRAKEQDR